MQINISVSLVKQHTNNKIAICQVRETIGQYSITYMRSERVTVTDGRNRRKKAVQHMVRIT